jgi:hypothetical protein
MQCSTRCLERNKMPHSKINHYGNGGDFKYVQKFRVHKGIKFGVKFNVK